METIYRATAVYLILLALFRVAGKRSLSDATAFDFVLLLIVSEAAQQALVANDSSVTTALLVIVTFIALDIALSFAKWRSPRVERLIDSVPLLIFADGHLLEQRARRERVDEEDILASARHLHGLERLDRIRYAVLEPSGGISIIPKS